MKGPYTKTVSKVITRLLNSVKARNNGDFETSFSCPPEDPDIWTTQYIKALALIRRAVLHQLDNRAVYQYRNSLLPIGKLPTELIVEIFKFHIHFDRRKNEDTRTDMRRLHVLAQVCTRWWKIAKSTPQFWVHIHASHGYVVEHQIFRSATLPLSITFQAPYISLAGEEFMDIVVEKRDQWRSLTISADEADWAEIEPYVAKPMVLLEEATLEGRAFDVDSDDDSDNNSDENPDDHPPIVFGGGPLLRSVKLTSICIDLSQTVNPFTSLTRLEIEHVPLRSMEYLPNLLNQCHNLKDLRLHHFYESMHVDFPWTQVPTLITLPALERLEVSDFEIDIWRPLLQGLRCENLRRLYLGKDYDITELAVLVHPHPNFSQPTLLQSILHNITLYDMTIIILRTGINIDGAVDRGEADGCHAKNDDDGGQRRALELRSLLSDGACDNLRHIPFGSTPLHLKIRRRVDPGFIRFLPNVVSLSIGDNDWGWSDIQPFSALLAVPDEAVGAWICPRLEVLSIEIANLLDAGHVALEERDWVMNDLNHMVRNRRLDAGEGVSSVRVTAQGAEFNEQGGCFVPTENPGADVKS